MPAETKIVEKSAKVPARDAVATSTNRSASATSILFTTAGNLAIQRVAAPRLQRKPQIGTPGDIYEEEADRISQHVVSRIPFPTVHRKCVCGGEGECDECKRKAAVQSLAVKRKTDELYVQRAPDGSAAPGTGGPAPAPPAPPAANPGLIVEDSAINLGTGQMKKSEFLGQLRGPVTAVAQAALQGTMWSTLGSVAIGPWLQYYSRQSAESLERGIQSSVPGSAGITNAGAYIPLVSARVQGAVGEWARTGKVPPGVPAGLPGMDLPGASILSSIGGAVSSVVQGAKDVASSIGSGISSLAQGAGNALSSIGGMLFKAKEGGARAADDPRAIQAQLGSGDALEGSLQSRMSSAFGYDFSGVRVHKDNRAAQLSADLNARAFTVGSNVAFGAGEYQPGSPVGDALIAHELAHVVQQGGASIQGPLQKGEAETGSLEEDADVSAVQAVLSLWSGAKAGLANVSRNAIPALKSGLKLQRCKPKTEIDPTEAQMGDRVKRGMEGINRAATPGKGLMYWPNYKQLCESDTTGRFRWDESYRTGYTEAPQFVHTDQPFTWELNQNTSASAAIKAWLAGLTVADCASAAVAIEYDTIRAAVGDSKFDSYFGASDKSTPKGTRLKISQYPERVPLKYFLITTEGGAGDLKPGDWYYFKNHPNYKFKHPAGLWSGENAIYLGKENGSRMWSGFGAARKKEEDMLKALLDAYNARRGPDDQAELEKTRSENAGTLPPEYRYTTEGGTLKEDLGNDPRAIVRAGGGLMIQEGGWRLNWVQVQGLRDK